MLLSELNLGQTVNLNQDLEINILLSGSGSRSELESEVTIIHVEFSTHAQIQWLQIKHRSVFEG